MYKEKIDYLDSLVCRDIRFPMAILVVMLHIPKLPILDKIDNTTSISTFSGLSIYIFLRELIGWIGSIAVPAFFIISGYFFFSSEWTIKTYFSKLRKRFHTLFVPYLTWILISICFTLSFVVGGIVVHGKEWSILSDWFTNNWHFSLFYDFKKVETEMNLNWLGNMRPIYFPYLQPMWFVRDLICMVIISPIIYHTISKFKIIAMSILALSYISGIEIPLCGFSSVAIFYFSLGAFLRIHNLQLSSFFQLHIIKYTSLLISITLLPILLYFGNITISYYLQPLFTMSMTAVAFNIIIYMERCLNKEDVATIFRKILRLFEALSNSTFFIYASHAVFGLYLSDIFINKIIPKELLSNNTVALPFIYILYAIATIIICWIAYFLTKRILPQSIYNVLTGGR